MERKPFKIYLDNFHKKKFNLYQKKIILPKKYNTNSNTLKIINSNVNENQNIIMKRQNNKTKLNSNNMKERKNYKEPKDSIRKSDINFIKNKYNKDIKSINSIIFIQKLFRGYKQRKKLKNIKSRIYLIKPANANKINSNVIFDAIRRNSKNQKEIIQLNNNRVNNRNTMSPNNNIKMNMIYKKNLILLKKDISRKKNYSFDYKNKEVNIKPKEIINPYKSKNKNFPKNNNKNNKNKIKGHLRINSCGNVKNYIDSKDKYIKTSPKNIISINNKNNKNINNNKSLLSSKQTKDNSNTTCNINSTNKSNLESPKVNIINNINNEKINIKQEKNNLKNAIFINKINEENIINIINEPNKTQTCFDNYLKEKTQIEERKSKNFGLINNNKYNFKLNLKNIDNNVQSDTKNHNCIANLDMPIFNETNKKNNIESINDGKINDNENDDDLKSSFYNDEEFVIINYDYTLNDKKKILKISRGEIINIDGDLEKKIDFFKFIKKGIYSHTIKYVFNLINNINKKKIEIDKTMTDNENASFLLQERIEHNNDIFNKAQIDINNQL